MQFTLKFAPPAKQQKTCLVIGIFENNGFTPSGAILDQLHKGAIKKLLAAGAIQGKIGQTFMLYPELQQPEQAILLVGCGSKNSALSAPQFRKIILSAAKALHAGKAKRAASYLTDLEVKEHTLEWKVKQIAEASMDALYCFDHFKTEKTTLALKEIVIAVADKKQEQSCAKALKYACAIARAVALTKDLANTPSNICTPTFLAEQARLIAKAHPQLSVEILSEKQMAKLGMGALLAVAKGSEEEAKLICLHYKGRGKKQAPVALVGKGITFDTGGNSLKSPDNMVGMKYDMCGAATVLGALQAAAELQLSTPLIGVIAAVENMPGGSAYKPEDILVSLSGQTIEVISTDAEGRLVLADALTYCERFKPDVVIDIATLTGAVVIALGFHASGLLSNDEELKTDLIAAGDESNDRVWPLPLWDEYQEQIKSPFADMANTGGRGAGTITAACFLSRFTKKFRWAHLDVAGTAAMMMGTSERMASGRPLPLLMQYLINRE
jgi:leucyl aminopeptidase